MKILVTGATGYIGSHAVLELLNAGYAVVGVDNLVNSSREALHRVEALAGQSVPFIEADIRDRAAMKAVLTGDATDGDTSGTTADDTTGATAGDTVGTTPGDAAGGPAGNTADARTESAATASSPFDAVMHFAGLKAVGESTEMPVAYYQNNIAGTLSLLQAMDGAGVRRIIFSSSATVYGDPAHVPIPETAPTGEPANPYGRSKLMIEQILRDLAAADPRWSVALLRYFNPVGAHSSGRIGEDPQGIPNNLVPYISQVAVGRREALSIFGDDYPTPDGTGVRDYIHVVDLARGHVRALEFLANADVGQTDPSGQSPRGAGDQAPANCPVWNLGTGRGYSVREVIAAFEKASGQSIPVQVAPRRPGDIAECYADPTLAREQLGWQAEHDLDAMMRDAWRWQRQNPQGYEG
ncbi:UDP-glucose 4-epimerase GalE [Spiribacter pallidus]|jgi:UDP-glucose 4-epimerase|uniref:UDP-glucose 4-epimerase n=1 Tax=Spiribacter pallidus TaxID=1987936 RepID=A0ABV3TAY2_9GAMM